MLISHLFVFVCTVVHSLRLLISAQHYYFLCQQLCFTLCQDPPLKLSIDESSASEVEEESDGVWGIVGGKVRKIFVDDTLLVYFIASFYFMNQKKKAPVLDFHFLFGVKCWIYVIHFIFIILRCL